MFYFLKCEVSMFFQTSAGSNEVTLNGQNQSAPDLRSYNKV